MTRAEHLAWLLVVEDLQDALLKVEWVKRPHGALTVCAFCGQTSIEHGGPDHAEDCRWAHLTRSTAQELLAAALVQSNPPPAAAEPIRHGYNCEKKPHVHTGYLHGEDDDTPYDVDGCTSCGRCHVGLS